MCLSDNTCSRGCPGYDIDRYENSKYHYYIYRCGPRRILIYYCVKKYNNKIASHLVTSRHRYTYAIIYYIVVIKKIVLRVYVTADVVTIYIF